MSNTNEFTAAANPALKKFADTLDVFRAQIPVLQPIAVDLRSFVGNRSSVTNIKKLLESFDKQGGFMNLASTAYGVATAANGFDSFGHFIRAGLVIGSAACLYYTTGPAALNCTASYNADRNGTANWPAAAAAAGAKTSSTAASTSAKQAGNGSAQTSSDAAALDYLLGGER
ncbi:MAG: hypothetical protein JJE27_05000 [Thermoleophilia bacterium]|nr:hypothetical protein [Thermoleophilia bacterium]